MTYIMSCVWLDYMVKYFQCKNCVGSSLKTKKCVASFLVPSYTRLSLNAIRVQTLFLLLSFVTRVENMTKRLRRRLAFRGRRFFLFVTVLCARL